MLKRLILSALLVLIPAIPSFAAATEADVKYSQDAVALSQEFSKVAIDWSTAASNPPTFAIGSKYNTWKKGAIGATSKMQAMVNKFAALKATPGFAKSDPLLKKACKEFTAGYATFTQALNKNDKKLADKATTALNNATKSYLAWTTAFAADVKALNG